MKFRWMPMSFEIGRRHQHVDLGLEEERRTEPAQRVGAQGIEGDVAEVEQAGEADDDVEPERHDRVGDRP